MAFVRLSAMSLVATAAARYVEPASALAAELIDSEDWEREKGVSATLPQFG